MKVIILGMLLFILPGPKPISYKYTLPTIPIVVSMPTNIYTSHYYEPDFESNISTISSSYYSIRERTYQEEVLIFGDYRTYVNDDRDCWLYGGNHITYYDSNKESNHCISTSVRSYIW